MWTGVTADIVFAVASRALLGWLIHVTRQSQVFDARRCALVRPVSILKMPDESALGRLHAGFTERDRKLEEVRNSGRFVGSGLRKELRGPISRQPTIE